MTALLLARLPQPIETITDEQVDAFLRALFEYAAKDVGDEISEALGAANLQAAEILAFNCVEESKLLDDEAVWRAIGEHAIETGALRASVRHAIAVATVPVATDPDAHVDDRDLVRLIVCTDDCPDELRRHTYHFPADEQRRLSFHLALCELCTRRAETLRGLLVIALYPATGEEPAEVSR